MNNLGGWHPDENVRKDYKIQWPCGSIFENEGKRLYDLVRDMKPDLIVEVGAHFGCSTTHMAYALKDNGKGKIISIDVNEGSHSLLPDELKKYVEIVHADALTYPVPENIDILFEDGAHTYGFTKKILERYPAKTVVVHDYKHRTCQNTVKVEFDKVLGAPDEIFFEPPTDCGLAIKFSPTEYKAPEPVKVEGCKGCGKKGRKQPKIINQDE